MEGKFDTVAGRDLLVTTGLYGLRTYDVTDARHTKPLDTYHPPEVLGKDGYWQDEDMEIDRRRKLIIGALDPRDDDVDQTSCPGIGQLSAKNRNPKCRSGFYVISYANPRHLKQIGDFVSLPAGHTTSCIDNCNYVWTGGPARRDDLAYLGPFEPGGRGDGRWEGPGERRQDRQHRTDDRGGLHGALQPGRPDRRRGRHELAGRRGRDELDAGASVPDDAAGLVPSGP